MAIRLGLVAQTEGIRANDDRRICKTRLSSLIWASRGPEAHFSLIWFAFWSSFVHGIIMGAQAIMDIAERGHLMGDVAALFIAVVLLGWLTPRERFLRTADKEDSKAAVKRLNS